MNIEAVTVRPLRASAIPASIFALEEAASIFALTAAASTSIAKASARAGPPRTKTPATAVAGKNLCNGSSRFGRPILPGRVALRCYTSATARRNPARYAQAECRLRRRPGQRDPDRLAAGEFLPSVRQCYPDRSDRRA